jgi:hypothetical protein
METSINEESNMAPAEVPVAENKLEGSSDEKPRMSESNLMDDTTNQKDDEDGPKSSAENIIPMEKLMNGWLAVSGFMISAANKVKTTAVDAYNSEQVANVKRRTSEVVHPAWEKTCEVAAPIWSSTVTSATYAVEKTKEGALYAKDTVCFHPYSFLDDLPTVYFRDSMLYPDVNTQKVSLPVSHIFSQVVEKWTAITTKPAAGGGSEHADGAKEGATDGTMPPSPPTQAFTELDSNSSSANTSADSVPPPAPTAAVVTGPPTIV